MNLQILFFALQFFRELRGGKRMENWILEQRNLKKTPRSVETGGGSFNDDYFSHALPLPIIYRVKLFSVTVLVWKWKGIALLFYTEFRGPASTFLHTLPAC